MADDQPPPPEPTQPSSPALSTSVTTGESRVELLDKARAFLHSPQVRHEDALAKRRFLAEKGLSIEEIDVLMQELPLQVPLVPPRTYPQPPPSNLPNLLIGVLRIASWVAGGSATLLLIYFRFLYPKIAQTFHARHSLRTHQRDMLGKFTASLKSLKENQAGTFAVLPRPEPPKDPKYGQCRTLNEVLAACEDGRDVPHFTLLRCALADLAAQDEQPTTAAVFQMLEGKFPWLASEEGAEHEARLWTTLSTSALFQNTAAEGTDAALWAYVEPTTPAPAPLLASVHNLRGALPVPVHVEPAPSSALAGTLQALTELTGFVAAQTYAGFRVPMLAPAEEDVRREIRALKGLVLNRRTFMPSIPRPSATPSPPAAAGIMSAP